MFSAVAQPEGASLPVATSLGDLAAWASTKHAAVLRRFDESIIFMHPLQGSMPGAALTCTIKAGAGGGGGGAGGAGATLARPASGLPLVPAGRAGEFGRRTTLHSIHSLVRLPFSTIA